MLVHTEERPFACTICEYTAKSKLRLTKHFQTHSDSRPFVCIVCGRASKSNYSLNCHMKACHPIAFVSPIEETEEQITGEDYAIKTEEEFDVGPIQITDFWIIYHWTTFWRIKTWFEFKFVKVWKFYYLKMRYSIWFRNLSFSSKNSNQRWCTIENKSKYTLNLFNFER